MTGFVDQTPLGKSSFPGVMLTDAEVEFRVCLAAGTLERSREELQRLGFPEPVGDTGERWDACAVWQWMKAMQKMDRPLTSPVVIAISTTP